ncbi:MAG TPA: HD domain-containing protein [Candidatus Tyrphobacter sp.]
MRLMLSISDSRLRSDANRVLEMPAPHYQQRYPTLESRVALRDAFAREGWVAADAPVEGIFPPVGPSGIAQPFWSTPGSAEDSHHAYPGGLCVHEHFNGCMSDRFASNYDGIYFERHKEIDRDLCVAAALYHDIMKSVVFQYRGNGTFTPELTIGGTGGHHVLSGAEAIARGHDARFVTVLLSAHAAPSLGDEAKVVTWCRAAAMLAGVDPVAFGLVRKTADGYALAEPPPIECFISHLSDHDYVLTVLASQTVRPALARVASHFGVSPSDAPALNWWRLRICANVSMIALYEALLKGETAFARAVQAAHELSS